MGRNINNLKISKKGLKFLIQREGFRQEAYKDTANKWTIGVGHLINMKTERHLLEGIKRKQVVDLLAKDVIRFERVVNRSIKVDLEQHQFDALASLAFNIGVWAFKSSTLVKVINRERSDDAIRKAFKMWKYVAKKVSSGLMNRRNAEVKLYLNERYGRI